MTHTMNSLTRVQVVLLSFLVTMCMMSSAYAQTTDTTTSTDAGVTSTEAIVEVETEDVLVADEGLSEEIEEALTEDGTEEMDDELEGIEIDAPEHIPGNVGLFWRSIRERVSLTFTFDKAKKIEKRIKFAEERMLLAEAIIASDPENANRVAKMEDMIAKAQVYVEDAQVRAEEMIANGDERAARAIANIATHQVRKDAAMARIETKFSEEGKERFVEVRTAVAERSKRLMNALENENIPEDVKQHLEEVKLRIETKAEELTAYKEERDALKESAKAGDEDARMALKALDEERHTTLTETREQQKERIETREQRAERQAGALEARAAEGDERATELLKKIEERKDDTDIRMRAKIRNKEQARVNAFLNERNTEDDEDSVEVTTNMPVREEDQNGEIKEEMEVRREKKEAIDRMEDRVELREEMRDEYRVEIKAEAKEDGTMKEETRVRMQPAPGADTEQEMRVKREIKSNGEVRERIEIREREMKIDEADKR